ncbi:TonB-dependent receptor plug domain-containing protein, partial [Clostridioides difficile]|uniref:TonB-dependent receptor plug domain-containing protein n=1 Tax=Clostridioides difficile TaxID=1496 RepID=UPI00295E7137
MTKLPTALRMSVGLAAVAIALASGSAAAQVAPVPQPDTGTATLTDKPAADQAEEVVVTGTRIRRPDLISNSPLTTVNAQELALQGANNVENVLNRLPQFTADANENVSNGSNGTANVNLRNLGSTRVLTLINGQRMLPA